MTLPRLEVRIDPAAFETFRSLLQGDPSFPATYAEWQNLGTYKGPAEDISITPDEFVTYCRASGLQPSLETLFAAAAAKTHQPQGRG